MTRTLSRRLQHLEAELAPPKDPEMMEIRFVALVTGEIIHRMFLPAEPPKRGRRRLWSQNAGAHSSSVSQEFKW
jgi:hypothetical protein